jgi:hypothetical protein
MQYVIKGSYKKGTLDGEGTRTYKSGKTLKGTWLDNELMKGKLFNIDGTTYDGEWLGGRPHGEGIKTISGGKRYEGMFYLGRPWGKGAKIDANEKRDDGYWDGGKFVKVETPEAKLAEFHEQLK